MTQRTHEAPAGVPPEPALEELYERSIKPLSPRDQLRLVQLIVRELVKVVPPPEAEQKLDLLELEGVGAEIWEGIDAQEYVNELRREWDHRP
jgi:hypothetical protein